MSHLFTLEKYSPSILWPDLGDDLIDVSHCLIEGRFSIVILGPVWCQIYEVCPFIFMGLTILVNTGVVGTSDQITGDVVREPLILPSDVF